MLNNEYSFVQLHEELSLHAKLNNVEEIEKNWKSA
jgi:hypothetical protein